MIKRALISVSDRTGLVCFVEELISMGVSCFGTRGTREYLCSNGVNINSIDSYAEDGGLIGGRVKTLSSILHCAIAARRDNAADLSFLTEFGISPVDMVVCNFYPIDSDSDSDSDLAISCQQILSQVDVGGPAMVRSAAKNFKNVVPVVCPSLYDDLLLELKASGCTLSFETRIALARLAFQVTSLYDESIVEVLSARIDGSGGSGAPEELAAFNCSADSGYPEQWDSLNFPQDCREDDLHYSLLPESIEDGLSGSLVPAFLKKDVEEGRFVIRKLRHGENPQQRGMYLSRYPEEGFGKFLKLQGKELSYNNLADADAAFTIVSSFQSPAVTVVKHSIPCGLSVSDVLEDSFRKALYGDFQSAFGGIIALNSVCSVQCAQVLVDSKLFVEVLVAPGFEAGALELLKKKKNLRLLQISISTEGAVHSYSNFDSGGIPDSVLSSDYCCANPASPLPHMRTIGGGYLFQDQLVIHENANFTASGSVPVDAVDYGDLLLAVKAVSFVKSNGIAIVREGVLIGVGSGQTSRVDSASIALGKAAGRATGAIMASDGFIPFPDSIALAKAAGIKGIIQPGGSKRDIEVTAASDAANIYMIHTGQRLFSH
jgi:phosphoribosylaminoimidazolecarboxamide formyltransferase/IMP cyclohydrolase